VHLLREFAVESGAFRLLDAEGILKGKYPFGATGRRQRCSATASVGARNVLSWHAERTQRANNN